MQAHVYIHSTHAYYVTNGNPSALMHPIWLEPLKVVDKNEHEGSAQNGTLNPNRSRLGWLGWENELRIVSANGEGRRQSIGSRPVKDARTDTTHTLSPKPYYTP